MGLFDGWKKRGRPRSNFSLEESRSIIESAIAEDMYIEPIWGSHKRISGAVFALEVSFISMGVIEKLLKHRNVRDIYFGPKKADTGKFMIKIFYG